MSEESSRELRIDIRRILFVFYVPLEFYQEFIEHIIKNPNAQIEHDSPNAQGVNPHWILYNHQKDENGKYLLKQKNGECVIEVLVRPTGQSVFRDFIQDLARQYNIAFRDQT